MLSSPPIRCCVFQKGLKAEKTTGATRSITCIMRYEFVSVVMPQSSELTKIKPEKKGSARATKPQNDGSDVDEKLISSTYAGTPILEKKMLNAAYGLSLWLFNIFQLSTERQRETETTGMAMVCTVCTQR